MPPQAGSRATPPQLINWSDAPDQPQISSYLQRHQSPYADTAARELTELVFYGLRDHRIRALPRSPSVTATTPAA
jgi:hypothetical protein